MFPHSSLTKITVICAAIMCLAQAVEVGPVSIARILVGDTVTVIIDGTEEKLRLLYLDTPEVHDNPHGQASPAGLLAKEAVVSIAPPSSSVRVWGPGGSLERDRYGRLLGVVILESGKTIQEEMISRGWSPLWEKYGQADSLWRAALAQGESDARTNKRGAWAIDSLYMSEKSGDTAAVAKESPVHLSKITLSDGSRRIGF